MTPEQIGWNIANKYRDQLILGGSTQQFNTLAEDVAKAIRERTEECAKIAIQRGLEGCTSSQIADYIRALNQPGPQLTLTPPSAPAP